MRQAQLNPLRDSLQSQSPLVAMGFPKTFKSVTYIAASEDFSFWTFIITKKKSSSVWASCRVSEFDLVPICN